MSATRTARRNGTQAPSVQVTEAVQADQAKTEGKPTAHDRLVQVLALIQRHTVKELAPADVKWGKAIGLAGGGSVYINRSNADIRSSTKQVKEWAEQIVPSQVRGPQGQYLRVPFSG